MTTLFLFLLNPADIKSPCLFLFTLFLPLLAQSSSSDCDITGNLLEQYLHRLQQNEEGVHERLEMFLSATLDCLTSLRADNGSSKRPLDSAVVFFRTAEMDKQMEKLKRKVKIPDEWKSLLERVEKDIVEFKMESKNVALHRLQNHRKSLNHLKEELKNQRIPAQITRTFIDIASLEEGVQEEKVGVPKSLNEMLKQLAEDVAALRITAKNQLLVPLNEDINSLVQNLEQITTKTEDIVTKGKLRVLQYNLRNIRRDLKQLNTIADLHVVKRQVKKVLEELQELKKDGAFVQRLEKDTKWLSSGVSYYIKRYSVWLVPNKYAVKV